MEGKDYTFACICTAVFFNLLKDPPETHSNVYLLCTWSRCEKNIAYGEQYLFMHSDFRTILK